MKTIAFVSNTSWSLYNFRLGVLQSLRDEGFKILLVAPRDEFTARLIEEGFDFRPISIQNYGTNPWADFSLMLQLRKIYTDINCDLVFHFTIKPNIYGALAAKISGAKSIIVTTGLGHLFHFKNALVKNISIALYCLASKYSNEVWFLNEDDKNEFIQRRISKLEKSYVLNSEGINLNTFKRKTNYPEHHAFLFAGRLLRDKGVMDFISLAKVIKLKYPYANFYVLGFLNESNPNSVKYDDILQAQRDGVIKYLGESSNVKTVLEEMSCIIFPTKYREGVSRILMEAAAMEIPIITNENVGCSQLVIHGKNGFLSNPDSFDSLLLHTQNFLDMDYTERKAMGQSGRRHMADSFDEKLVIEVYRATIHRIFGNL